MVKLKQVDKSFRDRGDVIHVARDLSWFVGSGESAALMGESGAGKTTLFKMLTDVETPDSGEIDRDELRTAFVKHPSLRSALGKQIKA